MEDELIGQTFNNEKLKVVDVVGKRFSNKLYKIICTECSEDTELFPEGYFISTKSDLVRGQIPCGCSKSPKWRDFQYLIISRRKAQGRFMVHGFAEKFHGQKTKLNLECTVDGHKWTASIDNVINGGNGCPRCSGKYIQTEQEALEKCSEICRKMNYKVLGFVGKYVGTHKTRFEYECNSHGIQNVSYHDFVHGGRRCKQCARELGNGNGYYPERKDEKDFLYVLDFDGKYIKVGRSFNVDERIGNLKIPSVSGISNITKLRIFTATHKEIYDLEQMLHKELHSKCLQYPVKWSKECFENESLPILNQLLNLCKFEEVSIMKKKS